jgi:fumarylacetoacetate (FAA) hydrolase
MFTPKDREFERGWPGRIEGDRVIQLAAQTLQAFFTGGGQAREHAEFRLDEVRLLAPVLHPPSLRHFDASTVGDAPVFHFGNPASIYGPDDAIPLPYGASAVVFELEIAAIIGAEGQIGGFTAMNDWLAPELDASKYSDFATSLGPFVLTPDELPDAPEAVARVNGEELARADAVSVHLGWQKQLESAARNTRLVPGDVLGLGAVLRGDNRPLVPEDEVELDVEGIGVLRNMVQRSLSP